MQSSDEPSPPNIAATVPNNQDSVDCVTCKNSLLVEEPQKSGDFQAAATSSNSGTSERHLESKVLNPMATTASLNSQDDVTCENSSLVEEPQKSGDLQAAVTTGNSETSERHLESKVLNPMTTIASVNSQDNVTCENSSLVEQPQKSGDFPAAATSGNSETPERHLESEVLNPMATRASLNSQDDVTCKSSLLVEESQKSDTATPIVKQETPDDSTDTDLQANTQNSSVKAEADEKKPVKSSMEILSELFSSFDAEPPVIVKKEKSEHKKHKKDKKKHKHKKKKEKKRKRGYSESDEVGESLATVVIKSELSSPKQIKIDRDAVTTVKGEEQDQENANSKKSKIVIKDLKFSSIFEATIREIKQKQEKDGFGRSDAEEAKSKRHKRKHHKHHKSEDVAKTRERHRSRDRVRSRSRGRKSEDEYDTWFRSREKDYHRDNERRDYRHSDRDKHRVEKDKRKSYSKYEPEDTFRHRSREKHRRDRSGSRESSSYIDKKKLLEIARRNAIQMMKSGSLPGALTLGPQAQEKVIAAIKAGGKTVEELTDFCKTLSQKEALGELSSVSEDSDSDNEKAFHHPFQLKDRPTSITMNIKNAIPLPTKTTQERTAELRMQFPVSSGQQHRKTETEWVAVPQKKSETKQTSAFSVTPVVVEEKAQPEVAPLTVAVLAPPGPQVFPKQTVESNIDVGSIVSQRLSAIRKLQENPNDCQAISEMYKAQKEMQSWAQSKQQPGQFTGSTGAQIMSQAELSSGFQAWARKDQLQTAAPVCGGMGMHLLQKMGWRPGEGLGKEKTGTLEPLLLEVKLDKKGLVATEEQKKKQVKQKQKPTSSLQGKHPVSLLGEYASKRKIGPPQYEMCFECGPDHKKNFLFKVIVNGIEYKPNVASPNKKEAKASAAAVCLQHLGLLPTPSVTPGPV